MLRDSDSEIELIPAESFIDAILDEVRYDPLDRGLQILDGHELPEPLVLDKPTIIAQLDRPEVLADVAARIGRVLPEEATIVMLAGLGSADAVRLESSADAIDSALAGYRTSMFIDTDPGGLIGAVRTMTILRDECPWDREQTHQTLVKYLVEETYELMDAVGKLDSDGTDWVGYAAVEDELGDVLLSVLFHAAIARQNGVFDIDDVAEVMRQKLVRRHPHVFGEVDVDSAADVKRNWDQIKDEERGSERESQMDGVPRALPAIQRASKVQNRAAKVGFDWSEASEVLPKVREEIDELEEVLNDPIRGRVGVGRCPVLGDQSGPSSRHRRRARLARGGRSIRDPISAQWRRWARRQGCHLEGLDRALGPGQEKDSVVPNIGRLYVVRRRTKRRTQNAHDA